jgi:hypothetical protein
MKAQQHLSKQHLQYSLGDLVDRVTILSRKIFFGEEGAYKEHTYLTEAIESLNIKLTGALLAAIIRLNQMNIEIWNLENQLRSGGEDKFSLDEIGRRAILIRDYNKKRVEYKNELNRLTGLGFREFKIKHRSQ